MKKVFKSRIFLVIITAIICTTITVGATAIYNASEVGFTPTDKNWKVNNMEDAINDLYNGSGASAPAVKFCTFVESEYGNPSNHLSVGSKYSCDPGDGTARYFYVLDVIGNKVELIMEQDITQQVVSWPAAVNYFEENENGKAIKASWSNVQSVGLPSAEPIAKVAPGKSNFNLATADVYAWYCLESGALDQSGEPYCNNNDGNLETLWLWDYTRGCSSFGCKHQRSNESLGGYWTKNYAANRAFVWIVQMRGNFAGADIARTSYDIRPSIIVLKDNLQG